MGGGRRMVAGFFCRARSKNRCKQQVGGRGSRGSKLWWIALLMCCVVVASRVLAEIVADENGSFLEAANSVLFSRNPEVMPSDCDIFSGRWVQDRSYPLYQAADCPFVEAGFQCTERGRTDVAYRQWRWQPHACNIPRFDAKDVLERLRNGRVVFVGDSMGRTQWESLICMLAEAVPDKTSIFEEKGQNITKVTEHLAVRFSTVNLTIEHYRAPFLVAESDPPRHSPRRVKMTLQLDKLHPRVEEWRGADVLVFNSGHWWTGNKTVEQGNYFQSKGRLRLGLSVAEAHHLALETWAAWVESKVNSSETNVFFRSFEPGHWGISQGRPECEMATRPNQKTQALPVAQKYPQVLALEQALGHMKTPVPILNVTALSDMRVDAHVSKWGDILMDCSHWCLPGVPDVWNELLYALLLSKGQGIWGPSSAHKSRARS